MNWAPLREAVIRGGPNELRLRQIREVESWLDLDIDQATAAVRRQPKGRARSICATLSVLRLKLRRDAGVPYVPGIEDAFPQLLQSVERGEASPVQQEAVRRFQMSCQLSSVLLQSHPELGLPAAPVEVELNEVRRQLTGLFPRAQNAVARCTPGTASPEVAAELEEVLRGYGRVAESVHSGAALAEVSFYMGHAAWMLARCLLPLRRYPEAAQWLEKGEDWFEQAGRPKDAADCRNLRLQLAAAQKGDLDIAAEQSLKDLLTSAAPPDPFARIRSLLTLADTNNKAGDLFEAGRNAEQACLELVRLGYPDPEAGGLEPAFESWVATLARDFHGTAFESAIAEIIKAYYSVLGARISANLTSDPSRAQRLSELLGQFGQLAQQLGPQITETEAEVERALAVYFPEMTQPSQPSAPAPSPDPNRIFDALLEVQQECNRRLDQGLFSLDDLLEAVQRLQDEAAPLRMPNLNARAWLVRAYILLRLGRAAELLEAATNAQAALLEGKPASLTSLTESADRSYYLEACARIAMSGIMRKDFAATLRHCEATVQDVEAERARVSSPYQQSAWIGSAAECYVWGAFAAFRLQRWDSLLELTDLVKARAAVRSLHREDHPTADTATLVEEFQQLRYAGDGPRRRRLWELISILQARTGAEYSLPAITLADLQHALDGDEGVINYFCLTPATLLLMVADREDFHAELIPLTENEQQLLKDLLKAIREMTETGRTNRGLDSAIAKLGEKLLPAWARERIRTKRKLIFVPHRQLHLFPFHAVPWETELFAEHFAVRYVPNLVSLLLPWQGCRQGGTLAIGVKDCRIPPFRPLADAETEATCVGEVYRERGLAAEVLIGKEATWDRLRGLPLHQYRVVSLATHGESVLQNSADPLESRLMLRGEALDAMDIAHLGIRAELVVLSACNSGQRAVEGRGGGDLAGDDIFGLQMALFQSGVCTILGTLWPVETSVAFEMVTNFHRRFAAGQRADEALQTVVGDFRRQHPNRRSCCYWAPFFLTSMGQRKEQ